MDVSNFTQKNVNNILSLQTARSTLYNSLNQCQIETSFTGSFDKLVYRSQDEKYFVGLWSSAITLSQDSVEQLTKTQGGNKSEVSK